MLHPTNYLPMSSEKWQRDLHRRRFLAALGIGATAGMAGCLGDDDDGEGEDTPTPTPTPSGPTPTPTPTDEIEPSGSYDTAQASQFTTLNPIFNTEAGAGTAIGRSLDQGYTFDHNDEVFPLIYDLRTDDGVTWVFELRDNLEFSDPYGQVTADDFIYFIEEIHQDPWAPTRGQSEWEGINLEKTGNLEFQAELTEPSPLWPYTYDPLEYPIPQGLLEPYVEEEDLEGLRQDSELLTLSFTGNLGPYVLEQWERGSGTEYVRNDDYYLQAEEGFDGVPYFEEANIKIIEEQAARLGALETGEVNAAAIPPEQVEEYREMADIDVLEVPTPYNNIISVNQRNNGWSGGPGNLFWYKEFRQAMACAINVDEVIEGIYRGLAGPHNTWQPKWSTWYPDDEDRIPTWGEGDLYGKDVAQEKVKEAIERSDYDYYYDGDELMNPDGDQVVLEILHQDEPTEILRAEFFQQELEANIGIGIELETIIGDVFAQDYWTTTETAEPGTSAEINGEEVVWAAPNPNNPGPRDYHAEEEWDMSLVFGLNTFPRNPKTNFFFFDGPNSFYNPVGWYPEHDASSLWADIQSAETEEEIRPLFADLFEEVSYEQPYIMITFGDDTVGYTAGLEGPIENFSNGWDFPRWYFTDS